MGSLNYLSILTRPDIAFAVSTLLQYLETPGIKQYQAAVQVFQYLKGTKEIGLTYRKQETLRVQAFVDSDWGNCPDTRRSTTGYVVQVGQHLINWKSTKQTTVSLLTTEAEYKAFSDLGRDLAWVANLADETEIFPNLRNIMVFIDNRGAIDLAKSETLQNGFRTKHMSIQLHFVRELIAVGLIMIHYIRTIENTADFLTKPTGRTIIRKSLAKLSVVQVSTAASHLST